MRPAIFPGWRQVAVALIIQAVSAATVFTAFSIIAVPLQEAFASSRTLLMMAMTVTVLVAGMVNPILGPGLDRYSLRSFMLTGAGLLATGFFLLSFTTSTVQAIVVYGAFMAPATVLMGPLAASTLLARWFSRRRGLAMGIAASGTAVGGLFFPPLLQGLLDSLEWRDALRVFGGIVLLITAPAIAFLTINRPADRNLYPDGDNASPGTEMAHHHAKFGSMGAVLRDLNFWFISGVLGLMFAGVTALTANLVPLVIDKGLSAEKGALLLSIFSAGNFGGKMLFAGVGDRVELRLALVAALLFQALAVFGFLHIDGFAFLAAASVLLGLAIGGVLPLWGFLLARTYGPDNIGRVMGLMGFVITAFNLCAPLAFGLAFDRTGSYDLALIAYIGMLFTAMLLLPRIRTYAAPQIAKAA